MGLDMREVIGRGCSWCVCVILVEWLKVGCLCCYSGDMSYTLCVDPGTEHMGWAIFDGRPSLKDWGVHTVRPVADEDYLDRVDLMTQFVESLVWKYQVSRLVIEMPEVRGGSVGLAANNSGALFKLAACFFSLRERCKTLAVECVSAPVSIWKGNTPKSVTAMRVGKHWGWVSRTGKMDESDAVGIGDWYFRKGGANHA